MRFHIENMTCGGCVKSVTRVIHSVDPDAAVRADLETRSVDVETRSPSEQLTDALYAAGYSARTAA